MAYNTRHNHIIELKGSVNRTRYSMKKGFVRKSVEDSDLDYRVSVPPKMAILKNLMSLRVTI